MAGECPQGFYYSETAGCVPMSPASASTTATLPTSPTEQTAAQTAQAAAKPAETTGPVTAPTTEAKTAAPAAAATAGGGGGGGGAGGKKGDVGPYGALYGPSQQIIDELNKVLSGVSSRYNPEAMQDLYAGVISDAESARRASSQSMYADMAARGLLRSAAASPSLQTADLVAQKMRSEGLRQIRVQAKVQEFDDKMAALDRAQKHLDSLRQYELGKEANAAQFAQAAAQVQAASIQVEGQKEMLMMNLAHDKDMFNMKMNQAAQTQSTCMSFCTSIGDVSCAQGCL